MRTCPACGEAVERPYPPTCPSCGAAIDGATESFAPVGVGPDEQVRETDVDAYGGPVLVVRKGPEVGERFFIDRAELTMGRSPESDIFLNDVTVSRCHARLERSGDEVAVVDVGSLNGTYVNNVRVDRALLQDGDVVQVGKFQMVFMHRGGA